MQVREKTCMIIELQFLFVDKYIHSAESNYLVVKAFRTGSDEKFYGFYMIFISNSLKLIQHYCQTIISVFKIYSLLWITNILI